MQLSCKAVKCCPFSHTPVCFLISFAPEMPMGVPGVWGPIRVGTGALCLRTSTGAGGMETGPGGPEGVWGTVT